MKGDFILFASIFIFIFILWVYTGGPTHPISFAGPYLTPVTNSGGESQAYGPKTTYTGGSVKSGTFWGNWTTGWGTSGSGSSDTTVTATDRSPYYGKVRIEGGSSNFNARTIWDEYITIRATSNAGSIGITGWQLVSQNSGSRTVILQGTPIVRVSSYGPIVLNSGDEAIISTGASTESASFKETKCTAYLDRGNNSFSPRLSTWSCPSPISELRSYYSGSPAQYNQCANYVSGLASCRVVDTGKNFQNLPSWCQSFVTDQLTYNGCVHKHQGDKDFFSTTWRIYQGKDRLLWRSSGDTITLLDENLKIVDQYSY